MLAVGFSNDRVGFPVVVKLFTVTVPPLPFDKVTEELRTLMVRRSATTDSPVPV